MARGRRRSRISPTTVRRSAMGLRGLTLGKFAPFHRGHEHLVRTALAEVSELVVVVYDAPSVTAVPLEVRAGWIRVLFPEVRVVEARGGPEEVGDSPGLMRRHEAFLLGLLGGLRVDRFYSGEFYGAHVAAALGAEDRRVDPDRTEIPVSATALRRDASLHHAMLSPVVRRSLVRRVAVLGAPSTGKSTLAAAIASACGGSVVPEHGRTYWLRHQVERRLTPQQLVELATGHREDEDRLMLDAAGWLACDTNALTTLTYARHWHGRADERLHALADACAARYALTLTCGADIPFEDTWDRSGPAERDALQRLLLDDLEARRLPHELIEGPLDARVGKAIRRMEEIPW
jgi:HTH-type transcriptional repressor of NAD biosynthesis genes